jgi:hypothetical protein
MWAAAVIKSAAAATPLANHVWSLIGEPPWDRLVDQLGTELAHHLWSQLTDELAEPLAGPLRDRLWEPLRSALDDQLGRPLDDELSNRLWIQLDAQCGGRLSGRAHQLNVGDWIWEELSLWRDCAWLAAMSCAWPLAGLGSSPRLEAVGAACRDVDWWWPMGDAVVLTDRPTVISRDAAGCLQDAGGPALAYADGYAVRARREA